jgi:hypothetical protein
MPVKNKSKHMQSLLDLPRKQQTLEGSDLAVSEQMVSKRTRHSFYLDTSVVRSLDQAYKKTFHELYPREISKSDFLEECIHYALSNLDKIQWNLGQNE